MAGPSKGNDARDADVGIRSRLLHSIPSDLAAPETLIAPDPSLRSTTVPTGFSSSRGAQPEQATDQSDSSAHMQYEDRGVHIQWDRLNDDDAQDDIPPVYRRYSLAD